jgi:hypothetical protein
MEWIVPSAANLRFLSFLAARSLGTSTSKAALIIELLMPLCFRSSCPGLLRCITNFGSGALVGRLRCLNARYDAIVESQLSKRHAQEGGMKRGQLPHRVADETPEQKAAREVVKLIRKLRWIGLEREAEQLQTALGGFPSDKRASLLAGPHSTD